VGGVDVARGGCVDLVRVWVGCV